MEWEAIQSYIRRQQYLWDFKSEKPSCLWIDETSERVFFLANGKQWKSHNLFYTELKTIRHFEHKSLRELKWEPLLNLRWNPIELHENSIQSDNSFIKPISKITSYQFHKDHLFFELGGLFYKVLKEKDSIPIRIADKECTRPKIGGSNIEILAYIDNNDIYLKKTYYESQKLRLTYTGQEKDNGIINGIPEYGIQEEFNRDYGLVWYPQSAEKIIGKEYLLFSSVDQTGIELVDIQSKKVRYPKVGSKNAKWKLVLAEIKVANDKNDLYSFNTYDIDLLKFFPDFEYLIRFGFIPSGKSIWAIILNRSQKNLKIINICLNKILNGLNIEDIDIIYEEFNELWINISDVFYFFKDSTPFHIKMIISNESSGFRHLYYIEKPQGKPFTLYPITSGNWAVVDHPLIVDEINHFVYFHSKKECPTETHLHVVNYLSPNNKIKLVTQLGYSHEVITDKKLNWFIDAYSALEVKPIYQILYNFIDKGFPILKKKAYLKCPVKEMLELKSKIPKEDIFKVVIKDGVTIFGTMIIPPVIDYKLTYPVILHIYGGPKIQLITNEYHRTNNLMHYLLANLDVIVIKIDPRGSYNRGLLFESHLRYGFGNLEINDQIEVLNILKNTNAPFLDLKRVAVEGWSYGGYASLIAIKNYPSVFKMAIAGAPVTDWHHYCAAYAERYLGLNPLLNSVYKKSSPLSFAIDFPNETHRILLIHGKKDDNVHYEHTLRLIHKFEELNKPFHLHYYEDEAHGFKNYTNLIHYFNLVIFWVKNYL